MVVSEGITIARLVKALAAASPFGS